MISVSNISAAELVYHDYRVNTDEIAKGIKRLSSEQGLIPVGLTAVGGRMHVQSVPNSIIGATAWQIATYKSVDSFFAGLDEHVAEGFTPIDLAASGEMLMVLYLKMNIKTKGWKWIATKIDGQAVADGISKFVRQGYIPVGMTIVSDAFGVLLIEPTNCKLQQWQIGVYSRNVKEIKTNVNKAIKAGFIPFGLILNETNSNIMLVQVEMTDAKPADNAAKTGPARKTDPTRSLMRPEKLLVEVSSFIELMRANPEAAGNLFMAVEAEVVYADILKVCGPGLKYFAHGVIPFLSYQSDSEALIGLYHPWSDTLMITRWCLNDAGLLIYDVELVTGDFIRQAGEPPYEISPEWLISEEKFPPAALRKVTRDTSAAFVSVFAKAYPGNWRHELIPLRNPELLSANLVLVATRISSSIKALEKLFKSSENAGLVTALGSTMSKLHAGDFAPVLKQAANTSKASSTLVEKSSAEFWQRSQLMALRCDSSSGFIFLNAPGVPWMFSCLYFEKQAGNMGLSNIEILDFPVQDAFKGVNQ